MISVLMSIYNEKKVWVKDAISSILNQTYQDFEVIIIVDNPKLSKDLISYLNFLAENDSRIKIYFNETNIGLAMSLNKGLKYVSGDFIARMDADDISMPERFQKEIEYLKKTGKDLVSCQRINISEDGNEMDIVMHLSDNPNRELPFTNFIVHPGVMVRTEVLKALHGYRNFYMSQDYDLWLRMITYGYDIGVLKDVLLKYRIRKNGISEKNKLEQFYISEYQKKLYRERLRTGQDSFSEDNLKEYICKKRITPKKNYYYTLSRTKMNDAIKKFKMKDITFVVPLAKAFIYYPKVSLKIIWSICRMKISLL